MVVGLQVCSPPLVSSFSGKLMQVRNLGAGWGGCTVSLVEEERVPEFIEKMRTSYPPYHGLHGDELAEVIFPTKPSGGASGMLDFCMNNLSSRADR